MSWRSSAGRRSRSPAGNPPRAGSRRRSRWRTTPVRAGTSPTISPSRSSRRPAIARPSRCEGDLLGEIPNTLALNYVLHSRGKLRLAQRRPADAAADLEELARRERVWRSGNPSTLPYRSALCGALLRRGDRDRARELAEEELDLARRFGAPRAIGVSLRTLALTHDGSRAIQLLDESASVLAECGAMLEHARALNDLGATLRRAGRGPAAREQLRLALDAATACGAGALAGRARDELVAAGARPRRERLHGAEALTPSERRVARLAAEGLTNREIAQSLFVTARTVETHLTHVFRKLGISSRSQLTPELVEPQVGSHAW
jgi:DNA-binding CsgD family transcriptional regulator